MKTLINWVRNFFPIRAKTFDEFTQLLFENNCHEVVGEVIIQGPEGDLFGDTSAFVGNIGTFYYGGEFTARSSVGRRIVYKEQNFTRFGSDRGRSDFKARELAALQIVYTVYARLKLLKEKLHDVNVTMMGPLGPMDQEALERLQNDAMTYNIQPAYS